MRDVLIFNAQSRLNTFTIVKFVLRSIGDVKRISRLWLVVYVFQIAQQENGV